MKQFALGKCGPWFGYTAMALFFMAAAAASVSAQPLRIAVGAASVASLPTWVAHDGGYFAREGVPDELI